MTIFEQLKKCGLNHSESTVYIFLLQYGLATPPIVSRETMIARTNCYNLLEGLVEKGLIEERMEGRRKAYAAKDPNALIHLVEQQRATAQNVLVELQGIYTTQKNKPIIHFYDGWDQIRQLYALSLGAKTVYQVGSVAALGEEGQVFYSYYQGQLKERGINYQEVIDDNSGIVSQETQRLLEDLYEGITKPELNNTPTNLLIWENNVAFITYKDPAFATLCTNKPLFEAFSLLFRVLKSR